ncbi:hypothetical protein O9993_18370 [Vibrio lentus]|nr:hypothetical protein [Vibrio lentus]
MISLSCSAKAGFSVFFAPSCPFNYVIKAPSIVTDCHRRSLCRPYLKRDLESADRVTH